jgi:hypothetical protein
VNFCEGASSNVSKSFKGNWTRTKKLFDSLKDVTLLIQKQHTWSGGTREHFFPGKGLFGKMF